jgi:hypothetical protein
VIERDVNGIAGSVETDGQAQITNGAATIRFNENVLRFQISVGDSRLACSRYRVLE